MQDGVSSLRAIMSKMSGLTKSRRDFVAHVLILFLSIRGRINFLQLARHSDAYEESTCRLQFEQYMDFASLNQHYIQEKGSGHFVLAFDLSYLPKSGKATPGTGRYWSGAAQRSLWGLEVGLLSAIDMDYQTAFHLEAIQTPALAERAAKGIDLVDHYAQAILWSCPQIASLSTYLAVDAYFAKGEFIGQIRKRSPLHIISRLRQDANCYYLYQGPKRAGRGAPRKYEGKIDWLKPNWAYFTLQHEDEQLRVYDGVVYCKFLKANIRLAYCQQLDDKKQVLAYKLYFCTDLNLPAWMIVRYYQARFQQEFLIRDGKQFTGLASCQARSVNKLEYHWNAALTAVNVAKVEHWLSQPKQERGSFSMHDVKTFYHNKLLIDRFFDILPESAQLTKNDPQIKQLYYFGSIAA